MVNHSSINEIDSNKTIYGLVGIKNGEIYYLTRENKDKLVLYTNKLAIKDFKQMCKYKNKEFDDFRIVTFTINEVIE